MQIPPQIQTNYIESFQFLDARKRRQVSQLILLNNLQRGDQNIAATLLITLFNRLMAALYDDKIQVKFLPSQGITQDQLNSYNTLSQSDYLEMGMAKLDYDWCWDTLFFGRGYLETYQFDMKRKIMKPHVINPLVFGYDPYFEDPQDWRYYWKWVTKTKYDIDRLIKSGKIDGITSSDEIADGVDPQLWEYKQRRDSAAKAVEPGPAPAQTDVYQILEYFGYNKDGDKCVSWIDKNFSKVLFEEKLELDDLEYEDGSIGSKWPIVVKESFRIPHTSVPISVADLLEDKHRAKSVLLNLAFIAAKDTANPLYWYDPDKVIDITQFVSRQVSQHIAVEGNGANAVGPLNTKPPMPPELSAFLQTLQQEATDPVGETMRPMGAGKMTATQAALDQQMNDMAHSLQSKVFQFGVADFWSAWFHRYAKHGPELKDKIANIVGVKGVTTSEISMKDFVTNYPPGVMVYSAKEAEYKELVLRRDLMQLYPDLMQSLEPDGLRNFNKHIFFPKFLQDPSLIDIMFPKTIEETKAETENEMLVKDELPNALPTDDHTTHIYTHHMVQPKTWSTWLHLQQHEDMLSQQKAQQQQMQQQQMLQSPQSGVQSPAAGQSSALSPLNAAVPLKSNAVTPMSGNNINQ